MDEPGREFGFHDSDGAGRVIQLHGELEQRKEEGRRVRLRTLCDRVADLFAVLQRPLDETHFGQLESVQKLVHLEGRQEELLLAQTHGVLVHLHLPELGRLRVGTHLQVRVVHAQEAVLGFGGAVASERDVAEVVADVSRGQPPVGEKGVPEGDDAVVLQFRGPVGEHHRQVGPPVAGAVEALGLHGGGGPPEEEGIEGVERVHGHHARGKAIHDVYPALLVHSAGQHQTVAPEGPIAG